VLRYTKRLAFRALACGVLFVCAVGIWLLAGQQPYPRHVQFRAPHRGVMAAMIDLIWFKPSSPPILRLFPQSWIPVVYAQECGTPNCNNQTGYQTTVPCLGCGSGWFNQGCQYTPKNSYCTTQDTNCPGGGTCTRLPNNTTKCNPVS
jgi:hypothetical protein